jgi:hypothetical protein
MVQFVLLTRADYDAITTKESRTLYFISDTQELYRGTVNFTNAVIFHGAANSQNPRPAAGAVGKLYINEATGEGTVWNGSAWSTVIPVVSQTVLDSNDQPVTLPVSGAAVKAFVEANAASTLANCITALTYDTSTKAIVTTKNSQQSSTVLTGLGISIAYDGSTGALTLKDVNNTVLSTVNIPLDNFVTSGTYNQTTKNLVLTLRDNSVVNIPAADLVKIYNDLDTNTVDITIENDDDSNSPTYGKNLISANVKISSASGNAITAVSDGLYVAPSTTKMNKVTTGHADEVLIAAADGDAALSGKKIGGAALYTAGTVTETDNDSESPTYGQEIQRPETAQEVAAKQANLLATEAAVSTAKQDVLTYAGNTYVLLSNVVATAAEIDTDNPSSDKVISERALVEAMSWIEIEPPQSEPGE